jgi:lipopolysaccharide biosynthesis glycosyltransferase
MLSAAKKRKKFKQGGAPKNDLRRKEMKRKNEVNVFFASDERYLPYLAVAIKSLSDTAKGDYIYNVNVLSEGFGEKELSDLMPLLSEKVKVKVHDVKKKIGALREHLEFRLRDYYSVSIYYRMFIPSMFPELERAVYLDCDLVLCDDVAKLYFTELEDNLVGAVTDESVITVPVFCDYVKRHIGLESEHGYFNSGVLLMNLDLMRRTGIENMFIRLLRKYNFNTVAPDQDYLNFLCRGRVRYLDEGWNKHAIPGRNIPDSSLHIMHYNMFNKPWRYDGVPNGEKFWQTAKTTPFYEQILNAYKHYGEAERTRDAEGGKRLLATAEDICKNGESMYEIAESEVFYLRRSGLFSQKNKKTNGVIYLNGSIKQRATAGR